MATFKKANTVKPGMQGVLIHMSKKEALLLAAWAGHIHSMHLYPGKLGYSWYDQVLALYDNPEHVTLASPFKGTMVQAAEDWEPTLEEI